EDAGGYEGFPQHGLFQCRAAVQLEGFSCHGPELGISLGGHLDRVFARDRDENPKVDGSLQIWSVYPPLAGKSAEKRVVPNDNAIALPVENFLCFELEISVPSQNGQVILFRRFVGKPFPPPQCVNQLLGENNLANGSFRRFFSSSCES